MITLNFLKGVLWVENRSDFSEPVDTPQFTGISNLTMLQVAWIAILLGFAIEVLLALVAFLYFDVASAKPFIADLAHKVSWSVIVCVGLAMGRLVAQHRENFMGVAGFLSAPIGFLIANLLQKSVAQTLGLTANVVSDTPLFLIGFIKAIEYACLGLLLEWLEKQSRKNLSAYIFIGITVGISFGSIILFAITETANSPLTEADLTAKAISEIIFPVGCSLVIFASKNSRRLSVNDEPTGLSR
ncbi:MAG: hypothetical protein AB1757_29075 [Acidobacteriota bacterium]